MSRECTALPKPNRLPHGTAEEEGGSPQSSNVTYPLEKNTPSVLTNTWRAKWRGTDFWEGEQRCTQLFPQFLRMCANPGSSYFALLIHCNHTYPPSAHPPQLASHPGWVRFQPITGGGQDWRDCLGWDRPLLESDRPLLVPPPSSSESGGQRLLAC